MSLLLEINLSTLYFLIIIKWYFSNICVKVVEVLDNILVEWTGTAALLEGFDWFPSKHFNFEAANGSLEDILRLER